MSNKKLLYFEPGTNKNTPVARFLVPCIFLIALGTGNIWVGKFKYEQYDEIVRELENKPGNIIQEDDLSPLKRLKSSVDSPSQLLTQAKKAQARRDFYQLVQFGGKVFLSLGGIYFLALVLSRIL